MRLERQSAADADVTATLTAAVVGPVMEDPPLGREGVFLPEPLDVNERTLPRAEREVLKRRKGKGLVRDGHERGGRQRLPS